MYKAFHDLPPHLPLQSSFWIFPLIYPYALPPELVQLPRHVAFPSVS